MYPNPEFVKTRLWEQEQDVIHHVLSVPSGMGPQTEKELLELGTLARGPRQFGLLSAIVRRLIQAPAGRIRDALRASKVHSNAHARQPSDLVRPTPASNGPQ